MVLVAFAGVVIIFLGLALTAYALYVEEEHHAGFYRAQPAAFDLPHGPNTAAVQAGHRATYSPRKPVIRGESRRLAE